MLLAAVKAPASETVKIIVLYALLTTSRFPLFALTDLLGVVAPSPTNFKFAPLTSIRNGYGVSSIC